MNGRTSFPLDRFTRFGARNTAIVILIAAFVISRIVFALAGVHLRVSFAVDHNYLQVLDIRMLHFHFIQSLLYLHIDPPLFNVDLGLLGFLPRGAILPVTAVCDIAMGLLYALSTFLLMVELRIPIWLALAVGVVVEISPATILYENWQFYTYPTAVLLTLTALSCIKFLRTSSIAWGSMLFASSSGVVLLNSTFQLPWMIVALLPVVIAFRHRLKIVLFVASLPVLVVLGWYAKNAILFGTYTTSSLFGMNLAKTTLVTAPPGRVRTLVANGALTPIALKPPFQAISAYEPLNGHRPHIGVQAVDKAMKADGEGPNLNNRAEIAISDQFLHDDLAFIKADPSSYLHSVATAVRLWFVPTDQYFWLDQNRAVIGPWARSFDKVVALQPDEITNALSMSQLSYGAVAVYLVALLGGPIVIYRRRRDDAAFAGCLAFVWFTVMYAFVATSLIEFGENNRFRFDLGALPVVLALVTVMEAGRSFTRSRRNRKLQLQTFHRGPLAEGSLKDLSDTP